MTKFAVFDIDGTLIRWQLYHTVVDRLAKQGYLSKDVYEEIKQARMQWKRRENPESYKQYEKTVIKGFESALGHLSTDDFDRIGLDVIDEYKDQTYVYTRNLIAELKMQGYFLLAISGSHHELIGLLANYYEFDDYTGSHYLRVGNKYSGEKIIASIDKESILRQMIDKHNLDTKDSYGIGDTKGDMTILKVVDNPIAFNPDQQLFDDAKQNGWKIVVERKNVVYQLEPTGKTYQLQ